MYEMEIPTKIFTNDFDISVGICEGEKSLEGTLLATVRYVPSDRSSGWAEKDVCV